MGWGISARAPLAPPFKLGELGETGFKLGELGETGFKLGELGETGFKLGELGETGSSVAFGTTARRPHGFAVVNKSRDAYFGFAFHYHRRPEK